ncbi:MAG TPA: LysR family transcriptional regulator [Chloroflexota bacterium]|nr:LysR family transcriptional regulator [Chloroflexota bacterium]
MAMPLSLVQLEILCGLAQGKTLAQIGEELYLTQPSISKLLHAAEREAGVPLVERRGRRLHLTPAGAEVARTGQRIEIQLQELSRLLQEMRAGITGTLRLLATNTPGNYVLPALIGEFLRDWPAAQLVLRVVPAEALLTFLFEEGYDFAVGPRQVHPEDVVVEPLYDDPITFFVSPRTSLVRKSRVTWDDIRQGTLVGPFTQPYWTQFFEQLAARGFTLGKHIDLRALEGVKRLVENSNYVGVLFGAALKREFDDRRLVPLVLPEVAYSQTFCLIARRGVPLAPLAQRFRQFLLARFREKYSSQECIL